MSNETIPIGQIYDMMATDGKRIKLTFPEMAKFYSFRSRLYAQKAAMEDHMIAMDILKGPQSLIITPSLTVPNPTNTFVFKLETKKAYQILFDVEILDD